jgi:hypothetical protein
MNGRQSVDDRLVRYLLGEALTDAEQAEIEERYFTDDVYFDRLLAVEDDLIDSYVRGGLSADERAQFEHNFLASNRRREKWEAQRAIASFFRARSKPTGFVSAWVQFFRSQTLGARTLATASAFIVIAAVIVLAWAYTDTHRKSDVLQAHLERLQEEAAKLPAIATFVLQPERLRSGNGEQLEIGPSTRWVVLRVEIPQLANGFSTFAASLNTADGQEISEQKGLSRDASSVEIVLPGSTLKRGDYVLSLTAEDAERQMQLPAYQFRIDR